MPNVLDRLTRRAMLARGYRTARVPTPIGEVAALTHEGTADGPRLTILHGWGSASVHHALTARPLRRELARLVLPDLPGHGFSDAPRDLAPDQVDTGLLHALDVLHPEPQVVLGSSLGGLAAVRYALARPERVRRLVLVSPFGAPMDAEDLEDFLAMVGGRSLPETKAFLDRLAGKPRARNWLFAPEMQRIFRRPSMQALLARAHTMPLLSVADLQELTMPVTVVWGQEERLLPATHLDFWTQLPSVQVLRPDRSGHSPSFDRPWWFEGMLRQQLGLAPRRLPRPVRGRTGADAPHRQPRVPGFRGGLG